MIYKGKSMKKDNGIKRVAKSLLISFAALFVLAGSTISAKAQDLASATAITNNADYYGKVTEADDKVYFKYVADTSGYVSFSVKKAVLDTENRQWKISLFDSNAQKICSEYGTMPSTRRVMVEPGTLYYIQVENDYNARDISFAIRANFVSSPSVVAEPNNSANDAKNVAMGATYVGVIDESGDQDFFRITAPDSGYITMDFKRNSVDSTEIPVWKFSLYDANMNELYSIYSKLSGDVHNTEGVHYVLKKNQTVYVRVSNDYNSVGELYSFQTRFHKDKNVESEPNNDYGKADSIKLKKTYIGVMGESTGDYYRFKATSSGKHKISLKLSKAVTYGYRIKVYDSSRRLVASSKKNIYKNGTLKFKAKAKKKYYVVVEHGDVGFFSGGRTLGTLYKLKVSK